MLFREGIDTNLRFLILEVRQQVERTRRYLREPSPALLDAVRARDDYIDHLRSVIQRKCFSLAAASEDGQTVELLKAVDVITANLERIADFCENVIRQVDHVESAEILGRLDYGAFLDEVVTGLSQIEEAAFQRDVQLALTICRVEHNLDRLYANAFEEVLEELQSGENAQSLVTTLFVSHYFERMGDSLLNIGEAIISACLGERIKIDQFRALEDTLESLDDEGAPLSELSLEAVGETRSGCRIDRVSRPSSDGERMVIFKEGRFRKLLEEKQAIERWDTLLPGLVPRIYSFHQKGETGAILFEYVPGRTLEELLMGQDPRELTDALSQLGQTLTRVWDKTRSEQPVCAGFMGQLEKRLDDVYAVHPEFRRMGGSIGFVEVPSFHALIERAHALEGRLQAPFSVLVHGDLNVDNIIYDTQERRVRLIDVHRSTMMDYVQDVSVFLVSNHRLQVFEAPLRRRINDVVLRFYDFARCFAHDARDRTFTARLALGLARSFATSTRFVLDAGFAKEMLLRSRYLIEQLLALDPARIEDFELPRGALVD